MGWSVALAVAKFAVYLGVLGSLGHQIILLWFKRKVDDSTAIGIRLALLGVIGVLGMFFLSAVPLTGDASGMVDPEILLLLAQTPAGRAAGVCLGALGLLIWSSVMGYRLVAILAGVIALWTLTWTGHVAAYGGSGYTVLLMAHLICLAVWIGILWPLRKMAATQDSATPAVAHQFGVVAMGLVPLLLIAGTVLAYRLTGGWSALLLDGYGRTLSIKIGLVSAVLFLAAVNKLSVTPQLRQGNQAAFGRLRRTIDIEALLILSVLAATAWLTTHHSPPMV